MPFDPKKSVNNSYLLVFFFFSTKKSCVLMYFCYNMPIIVVSYRTLIQYLKKGLASLQTNFNVANIYIIISIVLFCDVTTRNFFFFGKVTTRNLANKDKRVSIFQVNRASYALKRLPRDFIFLNNTVVIIIIINLTLN